ncbi:hypothetical protein Ddye_006597 [Dipteronia dyeriana]|uniref:Uncharacterized protein n=1 Tax=Dipteronia dyeriana TaxID=168575 RepID=A0AAD9XIG9_9ROSI|nr:hypothetical protein Ddye_006597 [Dipteronia dyeriana]
MAALGKMKEGTNLKTLTVNSGPGESRPSPVYERQTKGTFEKHLVISKATCKVNVMAQLGTDIVESEPVCNLGSPICAEKLEHTIPLLTTSEMNISRKKKVIRK